MAKENKNKKRLKRHARVRKNVYGTPERPRLSVYRSNKNIFCQIIDDVNGNTIVSASTLDKDLKANFASGGNKDAAKVVGRELMPDKRKQLSGTTRPACRNGFSATRKNRAENIKFPETL